MLQALACSKYYYNINMLTTFDLAHLKESPRYNLATSMYTHVTLHKI